jgi:inner membrane protein
METIEKMTNGFFNSVGFKLGLIAFLTLLLLIPANMIMGLIREREQRRDQTITEVTSVWGNEQTICGPIFTIPFRSEKAGQMLPERYQTGLPENLTIEGTVEPGALRNLQSCYIPESCMSPAVFEIDPRVLGVARKTGRSQGEN